MTNKGRAVRISNKGKENFLIDVTDRMEPHHNSGSPTAVRDFYPDFDNPQFNNITGGNNGIIVTITDKFSPDRQKRVYISHLGELVRDESGKGSFPNIEVLEQCGFEDKGHGVFVPFSFTAHRADVFFARELRDALTEKPQSTAPPPELQDGSIEASFKIK